MFAAAIKDAMISDKKVDDYDFKNIKFNNGKDRSNTGKDRSNTNNDVKLDKIISTILDPGLLGRIVEIKELLNEISDAINKSKHTRQTYRENHTRQTYRVNNLGDSNSKSMIGRFRDAKSSKPASGNIAEIKKIISDPGSLKTSMTTTAPSISGSTQPNTWRSTSSSKLGSTSSSKKLITSPAMKVSLLKSSIINSPTSSLDRSSTTSRPSSSKSESIPSQSSESIPNKSTHNITTSSPINLSISERKVKNLIIIDWDDTLIPSLYLANLGYTLDNSLPFTEEVADQLRELDKLVVKLLTSVRQYGMVYIITNAERGWIEMSSKKFLPGVYNLLFGDVDKDARTDGDKTDGKNNSDRNNSDRNNSDRNNSDRNNEEMDVSNKERMSDKNNNNKNTVNKTIQIISARSQYERKYPNLSVHWKFKAIEDKLLSMLPESTPSTMTTPLMISTDSVSDEPSYGFNGVVDLGGDTDYYIFCFGDSDVERCAVYGIANKYDRFANYDLGIYTGLNIKNKFIDVIDVINCSDKELDNIKKNNVYVKSIKFIEAPNIIRLQSEISFIIDYLPYFNACRTPLNFNVIVK